jgi:hypothetical protein
MFMLRFNKRLPVVAQHKVKLWLVDPVKNTHIVNILPTRTFLLYHLSYNDKATLKPAIISIVTNRKPLHLKPALHCEERSFIGDKFEPLHCK